jgi:hypothetical protein
MAQAAISQLMELLNECNGTQEIKIIKNENILRLNLHLDDLKLWGNAANDLDNCNIILACDNDSIDIDKTNLTWVVGAAIRGIKLENKPDVISLLVKLGANKSIVEEIIHACPGLCADIRWAFYIERHGWLCASPALTTEQFDRLSRGQQ